MTSLYILECVSYVKKFHSEMFSAEEPQHIYATENKNSTVCAPFVRLELVKNGPRNQCATLYTMFSQKCSITKITKDSEKKPEITSHKNATIILMNIYRLHELEIVRRNNLILSIFSIHIVFL